MTIVAQPKTCVPVRYAPKRYSDRSKFARGKFEKSASPNVVSTFYWSEDSYAEFLAAAIALVDGKLSLDFQLSSSEGEVRDYDVISELREMKPDWDGPGTKPPTKEAIDALFQVFVSLRWREEDIPDVQIEDDGTITMIWRLKDKNLCSIDIFGDGRTLFIYTDVTKRKSDSQLIDPYDNQKVYNLFERHNAV